MRVRIYNHPLPFGKTHCLGGGGQERKSSPADSDMRTPCELAFFVL